jgi:uncharacterized membrane protein
MDPREFIKKLEREEIAKTIKIAERGTTGEIRVFITSHEPLKIVKAAQKEFTRLGMEKTKQRNGVLIYVAPLAREFAIVGDSGVHEKCGDTFWKAVADEIGEFFRKGDFTVGIKHGIIKAGELLAEHFPGLPGGLNELRDDVETD